jgi:hypothetical protein
MTEQLAEERDDLGTRDVAHVESEIQPEAVATQGHVPAESREAVHIDAPGSPRHKSAGRLTSSLPGSG